MTLFETYYIDSQMILHIFKTQALTIASLKMSLTPSQKCRQHYREVADKFCTDTAGPFLEASLTSHQRRYQRKFVWKKPTICRRHFRRRNFATTTTSSTCSTTLSRMTTMPRSPASTLPTTADSFYDTAATRCLIEPNNFYCYKLDCFRKFV